MTWQQWQAEQQAHWQAVGRRAPMSMSRRCPRVVAMPATLTALLAAVGMGKVVAMVMVMALGGGQ